MHEKKILFLFPSISEHKIDLVRKHELPSENLYGVVELLDHGWDVSISDDRIKGIFGRIHKRIKPYGFNFINLTTLKNIFHYDIIIIKDEFSLLSTIACKLFNKKIIYKDSLFKPPKQFWKKLSVRLSFSFADSVISFSEKQAREWEQLYKLKHNAITTFPYCLDSTFYPDFKYKHNPESYVISAGRDPGRDFTTLSRAILKNKRQAEIVTLPYLINNEILKNNNINIQQRIPYKKLFDLYEKSLCSVVPLRKSLTYPTGIRCVLESLALGIPTIATNTPVLQEYFKEGHDIIFFEPENHDELAVAIERIATDKDYADYISTNGKNRVRNEYTMNNYYKFLVSIINRL